MRLFAALLPPEHVLAELVGPVRELQRLPGAERLRWTPRAGRHCTLAFYGEVSDEQCERLVGRLARAAGRSDPQRLRIAGGGRFGDQVLWAAVRAVHEDSDAAVRRLAWASAAAGRRAGVTVPEGRGFTAHLTLARARGRGGSVRLAPFVDELDAVAGTPWRADALALVRSKLPVGGVEGEQPRYETVATWPLGSGRTPA
ncbi:RNA 2',3'-cyclic phosphodiesterase [Streptomyces xiaopingdaonensis]|uniref:RNA 2',3'-cyclic phosphodiesterase n=1 Tax=Streptomyces xiaopingdaonensis TaxID=1565415 RepID=UPI0005271DF9|nr:RNA 2',3'-cyclic phosphodiesterase [Streptomyces xiaopingdaonensis]